jgi:hypothetical protein
MTENLRITACVFRSYPPRDGCYLPRDGSAGADKFANGLLSSLAARGHDVIAYNRVNPEMISEGSAEALAVRIAIHHGPGGGANSHT